MHILKSRNIFHNLQLYYRLPGIDMKKQNTEDTLVLTKNIIAVGILTSKRLFKSGLPDMEIQKKKVERTSKIQKYRNVKKCDRRRKVFVNMISFRIFLNKILIFNSVTTTA